MPDLSFFSCNSDRIFDPDEFRQRLEDPLVSGAMGRVATHDQAHVISCVDISVVMSRSLIFLHWHRLLMR